MTADGWRCPECGVILAPTVTEHRCDPPSAGVPATVVTPFEPPSTGGGTAAWPSGTTITVTNSGEAAFSSAQITELTQAIQRKLLQQASRNRRRPGSAA